MLVLTGPFEDELFVCLFAFYFGNGCVIWSFICLVACWWLSVFQCCYLSVTVLCGGVDFLAAHRVLCSFQWGVVTALGQGSLSVCLSVCPLFVPLSQVLSLPLSVCLCLSLSVSLSLSVCLSLPLSPLDVFSVVKSPYPPPPPPSLSPFCVCCCYICAASEMVKSGSYSFASFSLSFAPSMAKWCYVCAASEMVKSGSYSFASFSLSFDPLNGKVVLYLCCFRNGEEWII